MQNKKELSFLTFLVIALVVSACGARVEAPENPEDLNAPPVEGKDAAPPLESSAGQVKFEQLIPNGVITLSETNQSLVLYDSAGDQIARLDDIFLGSGSHPFVHAAGVNRQGAELPPLIYFGWQPEQAIMQIINGSKTPLRATSAFLGLAGAEGQPAFAYSELVLEDNSPFSRLYTGTASSISSASPFYEFRDDQMNMALLPAAVDASSGEPQGVWYTQTAWGIGGVDLVYPVNRGLFTFNLGSGENRLVLDLSRNFQGISPDRHWAASLNFEISGDRSLRIHDLQTGFSFAFPLHPSSDRGAGFASFSPDGEYVAWMEAGGSMTGDPPFQPLARVGETGSGAVTAEIGKDAVAQAIGWSSVFFMKPVGFLDNQTVLIEARGENWETVSLIRYEFISGQISPFCEGSFANFTYP